MDQQCRLAAFANSDSSDGVSCFANGFRTFVVLWRSSYLEFVDCSDLDEGIDLGYVDCIVHVGSEIAQNSLEDWDSGLGMVWGKTWDILDPFA